MFTLLTAALIAGSSIDTVTTSAQAYEVDPVHSSVVFSVRHAGVGNFYGMFETISGTFTWDDSNPSASTFASAPRCFGARSTR